MAVIGNAANLSFWDRLRADLRSGVWRERLRALRYFMFGLLFVTMPIGSLTVFAAGVGILGPNKADIIKWLVMLIVSVVTLMPAALVIKEIWELHNSKGDTDSADDRRGAFLELTVHFVPYGILSLSMLFEYHKVLEGNVEGMAALASIMILFILSELGLFLFKNIREARRITSRLETKVLPELGSKLEAIADELKAMPWVKSYLALAGTEKEPLTVRMQELFDVYARLLRGDGGDFTRSLTRVLLGLYVKEEIQDISSTLPDESIPQVFRFLDRRDGGVSLFATNVGFYASFLEEAVSFLAGEGAAGDRSRVPCMAVVTSALPSHFWNWPRERGESEEYAPIAGYREAQFKGVETRGLQIFRIVLVAAGDGDDEFGISRANPLLWGEDEWKRQEDWVFHIPENGMDMLPIRSDGLSFPGAGGLVKNISWANEKKTEQRRAYWISEKSPSAKIDLFKSEKVWSYYCRKMHGADRRSGRTDVIAVQNDIFRNVFKGCPDVMFLGTCPQGHPDIWGDGQADWSMALLSTMSVQTETMLLAVVHRKQSINSLWSQFKQGSALTRDKVLISSVSPVTTEN